MPLAEFVKSSLHARGQCASCRQEAQGAFVALYLLAQGHWKFQSAAHLLSFCIYALIAVMGARQSEVVKKAIAWWAGSTGVSVYSVAKKYGISPSTLYRALDVLKLRKQEKR